MLTDKLILVVASWQITNEQTVDEYYPITELDSFKTKVHPLRTAK